ncbi:MAG: ParB/RepB/Spo0J family partition protein [Oscillospiraceae bacterium]|nr:ParB/RepB/Spo0J family partition protein [Oscillospiraceae bacterium]
MELRLDELRALRNHPFQVKDDRAMEALCDSIRQYGVLSPLLARPVEGGYEIISGHRRRAAALRLGLDRLPVLVREMSDDEAVILMVDSNIQRENLLPSEKAFAYQMKLDAIKHQGKATSRQIVGKPESADLISEEESGRTVQRYIRLTNLAKPLLDMVDERKIALSPAVELSYLTKQEQAELWDIMQSEACTPSLSQAVRLKKLSQKAELTPEAIFDIMSEAKPNQRDRVRFEVSAIRKYFPRSYTARQMEESILKLLEAQYRKRQLDREW